MGRITINCYEMDFNGGCCTTKLVVSLLVLLFLTSAVTLVVHTILVPFSLIPILPALFRNTFEIF